MNKKTAILASTVILGLSPLVAFARPATIDSLGPVIFGISRGLFGLFLALSACMFLVAAFHFITANGDTKKAEQGREALIWASVGFVLGAISFSIPFIISDFVGLGI